MRIRELDIRRYGPLPEFPRMSLSNFTLFYGNNEHGKTLLVDAIIKLLFDNKLGRGKKGFEALKRVSGRPEGTLLLECGGEELLFSRGGSLADYFDPPLAITDFRNIFVARDSDLEIDAEDSFYTHISERFTDIRTREIRTVLRLLQERGRLTRPEPDADLARSKEAGFAARKVEESDELINRIDALLATLREERFDQIERELAERHASLAAMEQERSLQKEAGELEELDRARALVASFVSLETRLRELGSLTAEELSAWQSLEERLRGLRNELDRHQEALEDVRLDVEGTREEHRKERERYDLLENRRYLAETSLKPKIYALRQLREEYVGARSLERLWKAIAFTSLIILLCSIAVFVLRGSFFFLIIGSVCSFLALWSAVQLISHGKKGGKLERDLDTLILDAAPLHTRERSLEAVERAIATVAEEYALSGRACVRWEHDTESMEKDIERHRARIRILLDDCGGIEREIEEIQVRSSKKSREEYRAGLVTKNELLLEKRKIEGILENAVGSPPPEEDASVYWEREIERRSGAAGTTVRYDRARHRELEKSIEEYGEILSGLRAQLDRRHDELGQVAFKVNETALLDCGQIRCKTTADLEEIRDRLARLKDGILDEKTVAQETIAVFQTIEQEEKSRVADLFGAGKAVSAYFSDITDGHYEEVRFDPVSERISVKRREGGELDIDCLSGGTRDQLYFSIRLSLGERFLGKEKGFFIMDDPFIKADAERLDHQMALMKRLVLQGWQILYFSAKQEVRELLSNDIENGQVQLIQLTSRV